MSTHIILSELYYAPIHGDSALEGQYLVIGKFCPFTYKLLEEEYEDDEDEYDDEDTTIHSLSHFYRSNYITMLLNSSLPVHSTIRNYKTIVQSNNYFNPQIAQCIVLPTQETIAIIKTMWIKIIQRTWKKIYLNRKQMLNKLIITNKFQLNGNIIKSLPSIHGMLSKLHHNK